MRFFPSLRSRIFLASALLAVLSIGVALYVVNVRVTREAERALQRQIAATGTLVDQLRTTRTQTFTTMARLMADIPKLKAAASTNDPQTVLNIAADYQRQLNSHLLLVTDKGGGVLAIFGASREDGAIIAMQPAVHDALMGREAVSLLARSDGVLQLVTVPISIGLIRPEMLGTLSVGFLLDDGVVAQLKAITGSEVALGMDGRILASTLLPGSRPELAALLSHPGGTRDVRIGGEDYVMLQRPLGAPLEGAVESAVESPIEGAAPIGGPIALILRSRAEEIAGLQAIQAALGATAIVAVILATLLSFAVARTITRPLAAITDVMREVAVTGDLTRKIATTRSGWDDEDARLLASTFNTLTESIARFQREVSQKERLSSLGRLSTVIAHEIRNPLMVIKASLHALRQPGLSAESGREAIADIDEEVGRLNRVVNEVLDFARPVRFELAMADLNAVCTESAAAAQISGEGTQIHLALDERLQPVTTDAERLRMALVNMLVNARHAVGARRAIDDARPASAGAVAPNATTPTPAVTLRTEAHGDHIAIVIEDRGIGIEPADLSRMFDPYFTTKRGGTGIGLALAKSIVEGLRGTIAVTSVPGAGTRLQIDLPADSAPLTH